MGRPLPPDTPTPPGGDTIGIEIPAKVKQAIGLDDARSWVMVFEHNIDERPNAGLSPVQKATRALHRMAFARLSP